MRVLIVDDDVALTQVLRETCRDLGHEAICVQEACRCLPALEGEHPQLVVLDVRLRDGNGLDLLREIKTRCGEIPVAVMTGFEPLSSASHASARGADFFLRKPFGVDEFEEILSTVERRHAPPSTPDAPPTNELDGVSLIGASRAMMEVCRTIGLAARTGAVTLIEGESGVGKELAARAIHDLGGAHRPFIVVDCSTSVETLFESELFGHERGAFTGAYATHVGKVEAARGGVLFLDEIAELSPRLQSRLLRVLQERTFERVGGTERIPVDFQPIAATNQSLRELVRKKQFRTDLYYRLTGISIYLPPLRDRREDIPVFARHFVQQVARKHGKSVPELSATALEFLTSYDWPGNVRELENVSLRAVLHARTSPLEVSDFAPHLRDLPRRPPTRTLEQLERDAILDALRAQDWNLGQVCSLLGISRPTLRRKMNRYRLYAFDPRRQAH